jgi:hypothetical protein
LKLIDLQDYARAPETTAERRERKRAERIRLTSRQLRQRQRLIERARRYRQTWLPRTLFKLTAASAAFGWIVLGGADPYVIQAMTGAGYTQSPGAAIAAREEAPRVVLVDANGDGWADLASPTGGEVRGHDSYGAGFFGASRDGGRRKHEGCDYAAHAGDVVYSPIGGLITRIGHSYDNDRSLTFVEITDTVTNMVARVHYVDTAVFEGQIVSAGDPLGQAQDLSKRYPGGMTNHVHVEMSAGQRVMLDPASMLPKADREI